MSSGIVVDRAVAPPRTGRRVAVTGIGVVSPIGDTYAETLASLRAGRHGICVMPEWDQSSRTCRRASLRPRPPIRLRASRRSSRARWVGSLLAAVATAEAIADAGLEADNPLRPGRPRLRQHPRKLLAASEEWVRKLVTQKASSGYASTSYLKFMSHTAAANLALYFGVRGRVTPTCAACVSASQAIGARTRREVGVSDVIIAGGAEELHFPTPGSSSIMYATSCSFNDAPHLSPGHSTRRRDGLVVGEGAGTFIIEEWERAKAKGRHIYAEE